MIKLPLQITVSPEDTVAVSRIEQTARETIEHIATTPLEELIPELMREAINFGIKVLVALLIYFIGAWLIKKIRNMLHRIFEKRKTEKAISSFVESLTSISLTVILIIITVGALGVNTTSLAALLAAGGMAIGMALSGNLSNFAGGLIVLLFKPYKVGDFIDYQGQSGTVREIQMFHTILKTTDNKVIYIPNGSLSSGVIVNYSNQQTRRIDWVFGVDYGTDYDHVKQVLETILAKETRILQEPDKPFIALTALADSSVNILVRVWVKSEDYWSVYFDMNKTVYEVFNKEGINFPFPQLTVHQA